MAKAIQRAPVLGPAFIRLLARFKDDAVSRTAPDVPERLAQWFDWNRAITLSRVLDNRAPPPPEGPAFDETQDAECVRIRAMLTDAIHADLDMTPPRNAPAAETAAQAAFAPYRQHYLKQQRSMQIATGKLRGRLRDMLARQSEAKARLAEVDAVMEATLSPREHTLLANVPALLGLYFERLHDSNTLALDADASETLTTPTSPWLANFRQDLRIALLAELDVRFHPIEGLLAALRTR